jgi:hypothetical protein
MPLFSSWKFLPTIKRPWIIALLLDLRGGLYYPSLGPGNVTVLRSFGSDQVSKTLFSLALIVVPGDACEILIPSWRTDVIIFQKFLLSSKFHPESKWDKFIMELMTDLFKRKWRKGLMNCDFLQDGNSTSWYSLLVFKLSNELNALRRMTD